MPSQINALQSQPVNRVSRAIAQSARRTGVDFNYLMNQARIESGLNPSAKASTSSATGLYQFIDQSWLDVMDKHGEKHGLDWASKAISRDSKGRLSVADSNMKAQIFALRTNPEVAALMAGEFAADNRDYLENRLGREAPPVDLYLAHFLGPAGAGKFLENHASRPDGPAAAAFPKAAAANRPIFYADNGRARSFDEVRERFAEKLGHGNALPPGGKTLHAANADAANTAAPDRINYVQPADYVRLASLRAPEAVKPHHSPDGVPLASADTSQTRGSQTRGANESARLAYMMLASLGAEV